MAELTDETVQKLIAKLSEGEGGRGPAPNFRGATTPKDIEELRKAEVRYADSLSERMEINREADEALIEVYKRQRLAARGNQEEVEELTKQIRALQDGLKDLGGTAQKVNKFFSGSELAFQSTANAALRVGNNFTMVTKALQGVLGPFTSLFKALKKGGLMGGAGAVARGAFGLLGAVLAKIASNTIELAFAVDKASASFRKITGAGYGYERVIQRVATSYLAYGINADDAGAATTALFGSFREFTELSDSQQTNIATTAAILGKFGVSGQQVGEILNTATKSLGMNVNESEHLLREFEAIAKSVGKPISEIAGDFASAVPKIAFYGADAINVFKELEAQSKSTGLSVGQLLGVFGQQLDTFEGSGRAVGKLNALLGGPYLNSIDMLNASESERLEMLQDAMKASGTLFSDLNKFEQKAFASALGTDVDTLRKAMTELDPYQELMVQRQEMLARKAGQARDIMQKLRDAFNSVIISMGPFLGKFTKLVDKFADFVHRNNTTDKMLRKLKPMFKSFTNQFKPLISAVKFVTDNWKQLLLAFAAWKTITAGAWAAGAIQGLFGVSRAANAAAASTARAASAARMMRFAGLGLGLGMATGAGVNMLRNQGKGGAAIGAGILGGAASGAAMGAMFGPAGIAIGAGVGAIGGGLYASRDYNEMLPDGSTLDVADKPFWAQDGSFMGFGVNGGPLDQASRGEGSVFMPRAQSAQGSPGGITIEQLVEALSAAPLQARVTVQGGNGLKEGMLDFQNAPDSPMNPFNQGSF